MRTAVALTVFAVVFLALTVNSYRLESATMDEPQHLAGGYTALKLHDYRIDPEHPPFVRMWAALPLLATHSITLATNSPDWVAGEQWRFCHQFLFHDNDADRLLFHARFMIALLGVLLSILVFCWTRELFGFWPAVVVLGLYCTEPNLLAHSGLVTTDMGATCFMFGATYFAWRVARNFSVGNLIGLTVFFALAQVSKYSAVQLAPVLFALLLLRAPRKPKLLLVGGLLAVSYAAVWGVFSFRYEPTDAAGTFKMSDAARHRLPRLSRVLQWVDDHHLLPNACVQGFTSTAARAQQRPAYLLGETSAEGWWYYFPVAVAIKTPIALLLMALIGLPLCMGRWRDALFVVGPPVVYFGAAMASGLNIGLRHVLTVYPFFLLLAGGTVATLFRDRWRAAILAVLCAGQLAEFVAVYPHCLAFFNVAAGGPRRGAAYLVDSNLDWGQGLKLLKQWMTDHHVTHINLSYFGGADPAYYGIEYTPLTGASFFDVDRITAPRLPGYVAISATNLRGAYLNEFGKSLYAPFLQREPVAVIGYSIYVYWVERPWW